MKFFVLERQKEVETDYMILFGCDIGSLPFRYLGIPIHFRKLKNGEWKPVEDRFEKKFSSWIGKLCSYEDRLVLINSILTSLLIFSRNTQRGKEKTRLLSLSIFLAKRWS